MAGFQSSGLLMGGAIFDLTLPSSANGLYIGVQEWHSPKTYFRIDNTFWDDVVVSVGLNDGPARFHRGSNRCIMHPNHLHRFPLRWHQQDFELFVDRQGVCKAAFRQGVANSVAPLASFFVWVHVRPGLEWEEVLTDAASCSGDLCLLCPRAQPCPWSLLRLSILRCVDLCPRLPTRRCPRCPNLFIDYIGGVSNPPYSNAFEFSRAHMRSPGEPMHVNL